MAQTQPKTASLHRMVMPGHICPYGIKSRWLLKRHGYRVEDHWLQTREQTDAFKVKHGVKPLSTASGSAAMTTCGVTWASECVIPMPQAMCPCSPLLR